MALDFLHTDRVLDSCYLPVNAKWGADEQGRQNTVLYHKRIADDISAFICKLCPCHYDEHHTGNVCDIPHRGADDLPRHFGIVGNLGIRPYREQGHSSPSYYPCCADDVLDADANPQTYGVPLCVSPWNVVLVRLLCIYDLDPAALPFRNKIYRQAGGL